MLRNIQRSLKNSEFYLRYENIHFFEKNEYSYTEDPIIQLEHVLH